MKKKILVIVLAVAMLALPMLPTAQAWKGGTPREIYHDLFVLGSLVPDYNPVPEMVGNIQYATYTAQSYHFIFGYKWLGIFWDFIGTAPQQRLDGTATYEIDYKINPKTMKGVVHLKTVVTLGADTPGDLSDDGTFEGVMIWVGVLEFGEEPYQDTVNVERLKWHTFWKGTGAYEGWTIAQNMHSNPPWSSGLDMPGNLHLLKPIG